MLPATPLLAALPSPLNLRLQPIHLQLLTSLAGARSKVDVIGRALDAAAENHGLTEASDEADDLDALGLPRTMKRYPHPDLLGTTKSIEDTLIALLLSYRAVAPVAPTPDVLRSGYRLHAILPRLKLRQLYARDID